MRGGHALPEVSTYGARGYVGECIEEDRAKGIPICQLAEALAIGRRSPYASLPSVDAFRRRKESSPVRRLIDAAATAAGFTLRHVVTVDLPLTLMNLVRRGVGVAVAPARPWPPGGHPNLVSRPLVRPRLSSEIGIMRLRDRELSPAAAGLLVLARQRLRIHRSR